MGVWSELDIEVNIDLDTSDLDTAIENSNSDFISDELTDYLKELKDEFVSESESLGDMISKRAKSLQEGAIAINGTIGHHTLINSIEISEEGEIGGNSIKTYLIGTNITHFYPLCIENGRSEVFPINVKFLHYFTLSGKEIFSKHSKAYAGKPYVKPAFEQLVFEVDDLISNIMNK